MKKVLYIGMLIVVLAAMLSMSILCKQTKAQEFYEDPEYVEMEGTVEDREDDRNERYLEDVRMLEEAVDILDLPEEDDRALMEHILEDDGTMTSDSLRDSDISDETWERLRDDARFD